MNISNKGEQYKPVFGLGKQRNLRLRVVVDQMGAYKKESHSSVQPTHSPPDSTTYIPHGEGNAETSDQHRLNHQSCNRYFKTSDSSYCSYHAFFSGCDAEERDRAPSNHETIRASALVTQSPPSTDTLTYNFET